MSLMPSVGVSHWKLRQQVAELRAIRKRLETQVEALEAVAEEVVDTYEFAKGMTFNYEDWFRGIVLSLAQAALGMETEKVELVNS